MTITKNGIANNDLSGVWAEGSDGATIYNNKITENDRAGIFAVGSDGVTVQNNLVNENHGGVELRRSDGVTISNNTIKKSGVAVDFVDSEGVKIRNNRLAESEVGVFSFSSNRATIHNNIIAHNVDDGVGLRVHALDTAIHHNTIRHNGEDGVDLGDAVRVRLHNNTVAQNGLHGVALAHRHGLHGGHIQIRDNDIRDNVDAGLAVDGANESAVEAQQNWWGAASGPSGGVTDTCTGEVSDGAGDEIETEDAAVCFDPWRESPNPDAGHS